MTTPSTNQRYIVPDLAEFMDRRLRDISSKINCHLPGTVKSFSLTQQTASISINFQKIIRGANPIKNVGEVSDITINYPLLVNVPVICLGGGGAYLTFPITKGDTCLVLFCDRDIDNWFQTGNVSSPNSDRVHDLNDAIAIVGLRSTQNPISNYSSTQVQLSFPTGTITINDITAERLTQSGMMTAYGGASAPSGWLLCNGSSYLRTTYPNLFTAIGTTFGSADGTHFNVPDMRGQVPAGIGGTLGLTLGQEFGEVNHTLTIPEMPAHTHGIARGNEASSGSGFVLPGNSNNATSTSTGGDGSHNNVQPSLGVNWIIKI